MALVPDTLIATMRDVAYNLRGETVTHRKNLLSVPNYKTGDIAKTFVDTEVTALLGPVSTLIGSDKQRTCRIKVADVPVISVADYILIEGVTWHIKSVRLSATSCAHHLVLETS